MITLSHIFKTYNQGISHVVSDVSLTVKQSEILVLLGSSGSGKTTLLKIINRLIEPSKGRVLINDKPIEQYSIAHLRHKMGYVFQRAGLFPHMNVEKNIAVVLQLMGKPYSERTQRAHELMDLINLDPQRFAKCYPHELSGGQQQRVGVARALAANPDCLLMDEPFGALDSITRSTLQEEIIRLNEKLHKTIVFVTHDIAEAFHIADRIAVMHLGKLEQVGTKKELIQHPASQFVHDLLTSAPLHTTREIIS